MRLGATGSLATAQSTDGDVECICKPVEVAQRDIAMAAFDLTDIGSMKSALIGQLLLRPATLLTQHRDGRAERRQSLNPTLLLIHTRTLGRLLIQVDRIPVTIESGAGRFVSRRFTCAPQGVHKDLFPREAQFRFPTDFVGARLGRAAPITLCASSTHAGWSTPWRSSVQIRTPRDPSASGWSYAL